MRSPICLLKSEIAAAPFNVAPEKKTCCERILDTHNIVLIVVDEPKFGVRVRLQEDSKHHEIVLPIASLEYLWAFSHYAWVLIHEYAEAQRASQSQFNCVGNERLQKSFDTLEWAKSNLNDSGAGQWPTSGPRPTKRPDSDEDSEAATELFLCAIAWILHHEIAHVELSHPLINTNFSEQEEKEADEFATKWLLEGLSKDDPKLKKRAFGLIIALLCIQSLEVDTSPNLRNTHPDAHDRIFNNISTYQVGDEEFIEAICSVVLQYLFHDKEISANINGPNFQEILGDFLFNISRAKSSS
jgi:hypothetical protein